MSTNPAPRWRISWLSSREDEAIAIDTGYRNIVVQVFAIAVATKRLLGSGTVVLVGSLSNDREDAPPANLPQLTFDLELEAAVACSKSNRPD